MKRNLGRTMVLLAVGLVALLVALLQTDYAGEQVCGLARKRLPKLLGMEVALGGCSLDPLRGGVEVVGFSVREPGAVEPLLAADRLLVRLRAIDVVTGRVRLDRVEADRPRVSLDLTTLGSGSEDEADECFLRPLEKIEIDALAVVGAQLKLRGPDGRSLRVDDLDADARLASKAYSVRVSVPRGEVVSAGMHVPVSRVRLAASLDLDDEKVTVGHLEAAAGDLSVFLRGDIETLCAPRPNLEVSLYAPLDLISGVLGEEAPRLSGSAAVVLRVEGSFEEPALEGEVTLSRARVDEFEIGDAYLEARLERDHVVIDRLDVGIGEKTARARGRIGLTKGFPLNAVVDFEEVEFARILDKLSLHHAWVNFKATGRAEVEGQIVPFHLAGPATVDVRDFRVHDRGWDRPNPETVLQFDAAHVTLQTDFNPERARLGNGRVRTERSDLDADASLYFSEERGLDIDVGINQLDLADLGHILEIPWAGRVSGTAKLKGPYADIAIDGAIKGQEFEFHKLKLGSVDALVRFSDLVLAFPTINAHKGRSNFWVEGELDFRDEQGPMGRGRGTFENARLSDLVDAIGDEHWIFDLLRDRAEARISGQASVSGFLMKPYALIDVSLFDTTYFERKLGSGALAFRAQDGQIVAIDQLELEGPCGKLSFSGQVDLDRGLDFQIVAPALYLDEWAKPDAEWLEAAGRATVTARLFGPFDHVQMDGSVEVADAAIFGVELGGGTLELGLDRTNLWLRGPLGTDVLLDGRMVIEGPLPFAAGVSLSTENVGHYLRSVPGLKGSLAGELLATGTIERYRQTRGDIWVSRLDLEKDGQSYVAAAPVEIGFDSGVVELRSLRLRGNHSLQLSASGVREADGNLDFSVNGSFDGRLIESFTPWVGQAGGRVRASVSIAGPSDSPTMVGSAELRGGRFVVPDWPVSVRDLEGSIEFSQNKIFLNDVEGSFNNGRALVRGEIAMKNFSPQRLELGMLMDGVQFRYPNDIPSTFSGEVRLYGPLDNLILAGDVDLVRLRYSHDVDLEGFLRDLRQKGGEDRSFEKKEEFLRYDLAVHVLGDTRIDNNLVKLALNGNLQVVGTNVHMGILGTLTGEEGGRGFFRGNEISLTRVSVDFTERDRIAPVIDVHGETQVRDYRIYIHAYGPAGDPEVDLTSEPELARADLVTLLTLGFTSNDPGMNTAGAGAGLVGETLFSIAGLDKQVKRFIPKNTILRDFSFHISTQYSEVSGMVEPTAQFESKFLTDSLRLRLSQPVISGKGRRAQAEYRFNDHMSAQAQWDNESSESPVGDLGLDLKLRWELD
ncbi:MAG: translocation/assembly module TamB domain-containing protein [Myxococcales bacterium]|jgi:translocation and assembly module TamB